MAAAWTDNVVRADVGCWEWLGYRNDRGYGKIGIGGKKKAAHRLSYEYFVGPIPEGLEIDHLCSNRGCVRPDHLDPVTHAENIRRGDRRAMGSVARSKTHCPSGHAYEGDNLMLRPNGNRRCRTCVYAQNRVGRLNRGVV